MHIENPRRDKIG